MHTMHQFPVGDIHRVHERLAIALCDVDEAEAQLNQGANKCVFIKASLDDSYLGQPLGHTCSPAKLGQMYWFSQLISKAKYEGLDKLVVVCAGRNPESITTCALLIGVFMILRERASVDAVQAAFQPIVHRFVEYQDQIANQQNSINKFTQLDCWQAIYQAKQLGWVDFSRAETDINSCIDLEEYCHYDSAANGYLHIIVPDKILAFHCPHSCPPASDSSTRRQWFDVGNRRHFTPSYYAEVFADFDVKLVVSCVDNSAGYTGAGEGEYDETEFHEAEIEVERIPVSHRNPARLFEHTDRFLTLTRLVPGVIAVHGGSAGLGGAELLICAYLIKHHGFDATHAIAWVRMLHPPADTYGAAASLRFTIQPRPVLPRRHTVHDFKSSATPEVGGVQCGILSDSLEAKADVPACRIEAGGDVPSALRAALLAHRGSLPNVFAALRCPSTNEPDCPPARPDNPLPAPLDSAPPAIQVPHLHPTDADESSVSLSEDSQEEMEEGATLAVFRGPRLERSASFISRGLYGLLGLAAD